MVLVGLSFDALIAYSCRDLIKKKDLAQVHCIYHVSEQVDYNYKRKLWL